MNSFGKRRNHFKLFVIPAVCVLSFFSCSKDPLPQSPVNPSPVSTLPYRFPLTTGSYWVYQDIRLDSNLNFIASGGTDSVFVSGDSIIGTDTFKVIKIFSDPNFPNYINPTIRPLLRDSAGYLVEPNGAFLEHDNFTDTLSTYLIPGYINQYGFMRHPDSLVTVPAGTFKTIDYRRDNYFTGSLSPIVTQRFRQCHRIFADSIGIVTEQGFYPNQPDYHVSQLLRYHIQ
jgi:hypothetical protein